MRAHLKTQPKAVDVYVGNEGSVFTFQPATDTARQWIDENVEAEGWQWLGNTLVVDHRFAQDLAQGMIDAGLVVR